VAPGIDLRAPSTRRIGLPWITRVIAARVIDGDVFWRPSKGGANPVVFTGDSLTLSGFTWPGNTERLLKGTAWAVVENQGSGAWCCPRDPLSEPSGASGAARDERILIGPNPLKTRESDRPVARTWPSRERGGSWGRP